MSVETRLGWIDGAEDIPLSRQCELAEVSRATVYRRLTATIPPDANVEDLLLCRLIDEEYTKRPFYGSRRMVVFLSRAGHIVNRKRVQGLMRSMGLAGMAPGPNTSKAHSGHKVYPYLLRGVPVTRPNHVWSTDISYVRLARGFAYLVAVIDWYSRKVLSWRLTTAWMHRSAWTAWKTPCASWPPSIHSAATSHYKVHRHCIWHNKFLQFHRNISRSQRLNFYQRRRSASCWQRQIPILGSDNVTGSCFKFYIALAPEYPR